MSRYYLESELTSRQLKREEDDRETLQATLRERTKQLRGYQAKVRIYRSVESL